MFTQNNTLKYNEAVNPTYDTLRKDKNTRREKRVFAKIWGV